MNAMTGSGQISASELLNDLRRADGEVALLDIREEGRFAHGHILRAASLPLSRLELHIARLVPRQTSRIAICDDDDGTAATAAARLRRLGYSDVVVLRGGMPAWTAAGGEVFRGLNTPSKALGVFAQRELQILEIEPGQLANALESGKAPAVIDCRPFAEYQRGCIPGAVDSPGVELLKQFPKSRAADTVVINCAGRTRGLFGAQTLMDFGVAKNAIALRDGTMGWELAGHALEKDAARALPDRPVQPRLLIAAETIRGLFAIPRLDRDTLSQWRTDTARTTYLFDIRSAAEFQAGHVPGARHVAGGQLVQNLDQHVATLGARIVLCDDDGVRATAVALWLRRMGWRDVAIFTIGSGVADLEAGPEKATMIAPPAAALVSAHELNSLIGGGNTLVIDLATSRDYRSGHVPGAWFVVRSRLGKVLAALPKAGTTVLTSEDGVLAAFASTDEVPFTGAVRVLDGGTAAWRRAGLALSKSLDRLIDEPDDVVLKPSELTDGREDARRDYLSGSDGLLEKVRRDGTLRLAALPVRS